MVVVAVCVSTKHNRSIKGAVDLYHHSGKCKQAQVKEVKDVKEAELIAPANRRFSF